MKSKLLVIAAVFAGGAAGTLLRYVINLQTITLLFPLGTIIENLAGSLLLGFLTGWVLVKMVPSFVKEGLGVGFCGGFTTMSTLAADTVFLTEGGSLYMAGLYLIISLTGGVTLAIAGMALGQHAAHKKREAGEGA
ncbi:fluoride efflux transporter FluC [Salipaludibacillus aurantiacus]|uniref:Fluoride-specific ion channel FluC n=1 Tax=Salipaludibacillus aurantiacus TaxID=1601833 RepID=A0A1H9WRV6_9BACI|nr:CrcB family protein [Salipaludibacillus aurantiacus]SES36648.1 CrcB protein [Salipaludibacillus aurantiacus]